MVDGKWITLHREALAKKLKRPIKKGYWALHICGNRCCLNRDHLYEGTAKQNTADRDRQGRSVYHRGSKHGRAKLTEAVVRKLRGSRMKTYDALADEYGVSIMTMWNAINGVTWVHV